MKKKSDEVHKNKTVSKNTSSPLNLSEESNHKSSEKYRNFLENIHDGCFELDLAGKFIFFNDSVCRVLGYSRDELMGMSYRQYTDEENAKKVLEEYKKVFITGKPSEGFGWQIKRKDGAVRYIETSVSLQKDSSGKPTGFIGIANDITDRKQAEIELREGKGKYQSILENMLEGYFEVDLTGKTTFCNNSLCRIHGRSRDEMIGMNNRQFMDKETTKKVFQAFNRVYKTGDPLPEIDWQIIRKDGVTRYIEASISLLKDSSGKPIGFRGFIRDITERTQAEALLKQSEDKYRLLADHMKDQVWLMDLNMNITYVSPSVERLLGYSSDEIKKLPLDKLLTPESLKRAAQFTSIRMPKAIKESSKDLIFRTIELEFILKNGQTVWGECSFSFIRDDNGKAVSILGEARNINERKEAEEILQQTLDSLKKAVGTTIQVLVSALEARDPYTAGHQSRSANLACAIATEMRLDNNKIEGIRMAGIIHDIGKLSIPTEILTKPTKLTDLEFSLVKEHAQSGYEMLKDVESPWPLADIVHQHHERINGSGYPRNLKVDEILLESRILAVADVVEAMASHRPYRASLGIDTALEEIEKNKGILYDETVADACLRLFRKKGYQLT